MLIEVPAVLRKEAKDEITKLLIRFDAGIVYQFVHHIDLALSRYKLRRNELNSLISQSDSNIKLKKLISNISDISKQLNGLRNDPNVMHSMRDDKLISIIDLSLSDQLSWEVSSGAQLITTKVNQLNELEKMLTNLLTKRSAALKGGRPSKTIRNIFVRDVADIYRQHIANPSQTQNNEFEKVIKICFKDVNEVIEDAHKLITNALKNHKVQ